MDSGEEYIRKYGDAGRTILAQIPVYSQRGSRMAITISELTQSAQKSTIALVCVFRENARVGYICVYGGRSQLGILREPKITFRSKSNPG